MHFNLQIVRAFGWVRVSVAEHYILGCNIDTDELVNDGFESWKNQQCRNIIVKYFHQPRYNKRSINDKVYSGGTVLTGIPNIKSSID